MCFFKSKKIPPENQNNSPYDSLRNLAFEVIPEQLGINLDDDQQAYGAVVDMCISNDKTATMICFLDGTASLYYSNGGGIIGAGQHENVRRAVLSYLMSIHKALPIMNLTDSFDVIQVPNHHKFYLFTKKGKYSIDLDLSDHQRSKEIHFLFSSSQMVLSEIRKVAESK